MFFLLYWKEGRVGRREGGKEKILKNNNKKTTNKLMNVLKI